MYLLNQTKLNMGLPIIIIILIDVVISFVGGRIPAALLFVFTYLCTEWENKPKMFRCQFKF